MRTGRLPDKSVDAEISQFGFLQEGNVPASARELARVLKDGAPYSVAAHRAVHTTYRMRRERGGTRVQIWGQSHSGW
jgi:hypothetical protein